MIRLPPGCTVNYGITIDVKELTDEMVEWYQDVGGVVTKKEYYNYKGRLTVAHYVQYGTAKPCHYMADGTNHVRLHFSGKDASTASFFLLKFMDNIINHNLKEVNDRIDRDAKYSIN